MKLTVIHLWALFCVAYGFSVFMAFDGRLVGSILFSVVPVAIDLHKVDDEPRRNRSSAF